MDQIDTAGGCLCGQIRYRLKGDILGAASCHCRDCQYVCGGAPSYVVLSTTNALTITAGEPAAYQSKADSGATRRRSFCPNCGTPLFADNSAFPGVVSIKAGSLDKAEVFKPTAQFWVKSAPHWHNISQELAIFPTGPNSS